MSTPAVIAFRELLEERRQAKAWAERKQLELSIRCAPRPTKGWLSRLRAWLAEPLHR